MKNVLNDIDGLKKKICCDGDSSTLTKGTYSSNGEEASFKPMYYAIKETDFEPDGITCLLPLAKGFSFGIYWRNFSQWIDEGTEDTPKDFLVLKNGGFKITMPGFSANTTYHSFEVFLKTILE